MRFREASTGKIKPIGLDRRKQGSIIGDGKYIVCHLLRRPGRLVRIGGKAGRERGVSCE